MKKEMFEFKTTGEM